MYYNFLSFCLQEYHKGLSELEGQLDELEGLGMLLASGCVSEDKEIIVQRTKDLRYRHMFVILTIPSTVKILQLSWRGISNYLSTCSPSIVLVHVGHSEFSVLYQYQYCQHIQCTHTICA